MDVNSAVNLKKGSITSITGAGGKTSLMFALAEELRKEAKVLVTTTTKIYVPEKQQCDCIAIGENEFNRIKCNKDKGIYVYGSSVNEENKLSGISCELLEEQRQYFDYILVEADGAKRKPIKGWNDAEPVISRKTEKTIGVLSIEVIGKQINDKNVHRLDQFTKLTNSGKGELISIEHIISLIFHNDGLFKNSSGERIVFINKVENEHDIILAEQILDNIYRVNNGYISKVIIGKLKDEREPVILSRKVN